MAETLFYQNYGEKFKGTYDKDAAITSDEKYIWVDANKKSRHFQQSVNNKVKKPDGMGKFKLYEISGNLVFANTGDNVTAVVIDDDDTVKLEKGGEEIGKDDKNNVTIVKSSPASVGPITKSVATAATAAAVLGGASKLYAKNNQPIQNDISDKTLKPLLAQEMANDKILKSK